MKTKAWKITIYLETNVAFERGDVHEFAETGNLEYMALNGVQIQVDEVTSG